MPATHRVSISSIHFRNFKTFENFSVSLEHVNLIVGANNAGKSTIVGALRALAAGLQKARRRNPERFSQFGYRVGYSIPVDALPISLENVYTDYKEATSCVTFRLSNRNKLELYFRPDECLMLPVVDGRTPTTVSTFRSAFPISVYVVPVLGPVEHDEPVVQEERVRRDLITHRASRHFRNYWYQNQTQFPAFQALVQDTWPGMDITLPGLADPLIPRLSMFCLEDRIPRELYWAGFGFQIWCQLLTHVVAGASANVFAVDEPETYLHPDLQRQLMSILRTSGPDIVLATHSSELVGEADPSEIIIIDKRRHSGRRVARTEGNAAALKVLGSVHGPTLTHVARTRKVLFGEGQEFALLGLFARKIGLSQLANRSGFAYLPMSGFPSPQWVRAVCEGMRQALGDPLVFASVFDRDFRSKEEVRELLTTLSACGLEPAAILDRKETENYLLAPQALDAALAVAMRERAARTGKQPLDIESLAGLLLEITEPMKADLVAQYQARAAGYGPNRSIDAATINADVLRDFEVAWRDLALRIKLVSGKQVFKSLNTRLQARYGVSLSPRAIVDHMPDAEIPHDLRRLLAELDAFRTRPP